MHQQEMTGIYLSSGRGFGFFRPEQGDEILVAELLLRAVGLHVVFVGRGALDVHIPGVPLVVVSGHAVNAPVDENAEFGVLIPLGGLPVGQGFPGVGVGPLGDYLVNVAQSCIHIIHSAFLLAVGLDSAHIIAGRPGALYMTGPHVRHAQIPSREKPMQEYCVYLQVEQRGKRPSPLTRLFCATPFWFGKDDGEVEAIFRQVFQEFQQKQTGYDLQVQLLLGQLIVKLARCYQASSQEPVPAPAPPE